MSNHGKRKGTRAELKCIRILEAAGYCCTKAGGSLGVFDVIALGPRDVRAIQVKAGTARLSPLEREQMQGTEVPPNCTREYWHFADYARKPEIQIIAGDGERP